jgi:hypothetical protein
MDIRQQQTAAVFDVAHGDSSHSQDEIPNSSLRDAAAAFVRALVNADGDTLRAMTRGVNMGFPTGYVLSRFAKRYAEREFAQLSLNINESENRVSVCDLDGRVLDAIRFKRQGDAYFFTHFECY